MKALILNSGMGRRMGVLASEHPKCMTEVRTGETILSRQLEMLAQAGIREVVMTTGPFAGTLANYCRSLELPIHITYVENPSYRDTNYIYSIYCAREYIEDDILLDGRMRQFDAMWVSSLCDSTSRGKPDIELVDLTSRFRTIEELMEVTAKPVIFDGDTGGRPEHFVYTVRTLERLGVSMVIIEDKTGLKKNSLFGTEVPQTQEGITDFCDKIRAGKRAQKTQEFMICARVESLVLGKGIEDALERAHAYVQAGADAVMIHSREKDPTEIFAFLGRFREADQHTCLVVVPTSYSSVTEEELKQRGAQVVIYANQLMRAAVPAVRKAAESILVHHRAQECEQMLMPFQEIIRLIPEEG